MAAPQGMDVDPEDDIMDAGLDVDDLKQDVDYSMGGESAERARAEHAALIAALDQRKKMRTAAVPTDDRKVRAQLRALGEPVTLFGERHVDRRERLKELVTKAAGSEEGADAAEEEESESDEEKEEEFYTEGSNALLESRRAIASYSLSRAKTRVARQRSEANVSLAKIVASRKEVFEPLKRYTNLGSQIGDERPVSIVRFSPDSSMLATGSWTGQAKLWEVPSANHKTTLRGHTDRIGGLAWHPQATIGQSSSAVNLVTGAGDADVCLWNLESDRPLSTLKGHAARVCRTAFHPSGGYVASASYDGTWRLWDVASEKELLLQEGHSKEVYSVEFQDDGALIASGGLDAIGRVWDLRTGRTAMVLDGHVKEILSIDFSPNGYQVATASGDDTVRIWDMRALKSLYTIPAHRSSVADVRFFRAANERPTRFAGGLQTQSNGRADPDPSASSTGTDPNGALEAATLAETAMATDKKDIARSGLYLATAGYDGLVKIWSADDWQLMRSLSGDAGKVMSVDISSDGQYLASGEWGRSFKLWSEGVVY